MTVSQVTPILFFPSFFVSLVSLVSNRAPLGSLYSVIDGCVDFERPHALFEHLCYPCAFQVPLFCYLTPGRAA